MRKDFLKLLLYESIAMIVLTIAACFAVLIQMIFGTEIGTYNSFFFSETYYKYNLLMYVLGFGVYLLVMIIVIKKFDGRLDGVKKLGIAYKIIACIYDLLWGFVMFVVLMIHALLVLGLTNSYKPEALYWLSFAGLPIISALSIGYVLIKKI